MDVKRRTTICYRRCPKNGFVCLEIDSGSTSLDGQIITHLPEELIRFPKMSPVVGTLFGLLFVLLKRTTILGCSHFDTYANGEMKHMALENGPSPFATCDTGYQSPKFTQEKMSLP